MELYIGLLIGAVIGSLVGFFTAALFAASGRKPPEPEFGRCNICDGALHPMQYPVGIRLVCFNGHFQ